MSTFRNLTAAALTAASLGMMPITGSAATLTGFSDFYVFGDSYSDPGNLFATFISPFVPAPPPGFDRNGQVSDGDTWASQLGADINSGTNFAFASARAVTTGSLNFDLGIATVPIDVSDLPQQIAAFQAQLAGGLTLGSNPLAAVFMGGNDVGDSGSAADPVARLAAAVGEVVSSVGTLLSEGIPNVVVMGAPDVGLLPGVQQGGIGAITEATLASAAYNGALQAALAAFDPAQVQFFDTAGLLQEIAGDLSGFGFNQPLAAQCLAALGVSAANCDGFLFFDDLHPTEAGHTIIAERFAEQVSIAPIPLPASSVLLLAGLGGLLMLRRRACA
ncbi:MAG: SGNH/GDSL hydrolase family protein [Pseudomonadota bacterium]